MTRALILSLFLFLGLHVSGLCVYQVNWTEDFESYSPGTALDTVGWGTPNNSYPAQYNVRPMLVVDTLSRSGLKSAQQQAGTPGVPSGNYKDMTTFSGGSKYQNGYTKFWVYEPTATTGQEYDCRIGVYGSGHDNPSTMITANCQYDNTDYWKIQFSSMAPMVVDGVTTRDGGGYQFHAYFPAARRPQQWSYVYVTWGLDYTTQTGFAEWRINRQTPNLRIDFSLTQYSMLNQITGVFMGVNNNWNHVAATVDDVEFHGNAIGGVVPEPTSLLALGMGLVGLAGFVRRRK